VAYLSLYRKYRPQSFAELVGQKHVSRTLSNALTEGKVAHAYLFCGPRGTGKTTTARLLAKALNCACPPDADDEARCESCRAIMAGSSMDVVEMDAASNRGIDEIRALRERIHFAPTEGTYKVYIVDEVHMLTPEAFNALLKVLEEPPEHTIFVLCTTEAHKVPATISSRCQRFDFRRIAVSDIKDRLEHIAREEGIRMEQGGFHELALYAQGSLRDAISTLDQLAAFTGMDVTLEDVTSLLGVVEQKLLFEMADHVAEGETGRLLELVARALELGHDPAGIVRGLAAHMRNLYVTCAVGDAAKVLDVTPDVHQKLVAQSRRFTERRLERALDELSSAQMEIRAAPDARLVLEAAAVSLARPVAGIDELEERVAELERRLRAGQPATQARDASAAGRKPAPSARPEQPAPEADKGMGPEAASEPSGDAGRAGTEAGADTESEADDGAKGAATEAEPMTAPFTTEGIQVSWAAFLSALGNPRIRGPLAHAEPSVRGDELVIAVADETREKMLSTPDKVEALTAAAAHVFGRTVPVRVEAGGAPAARQAEVAKKKEDIHGMLKDSFGAEKVTQIRRAESEDTEA
jgi:DNA polymerase-3 subunit gamma/tau